MGVVDVKQCRLYIDRMNDIGSTRIRSTHTLTVVEAYSKNGNNPEDHNGRSHFKPSVWCSTVKSAYQRDERKSLTPRTERICRYTSRAL